MKDVDLRWQLAREEGALRVTYTVHNRGSAALWVLDQVLVFGPTEGYALDEGAIMAYADSQDPTLLHLVRGRVAPAGRAMIELVPGVRALPPGGELSGSARVPLPLRSWHPNDRFRDLSVAPTRAVLELGVLPGDAPTDDWPLISGGVQPVASPPAPLTQQQLVRGETLSIP